MKKILPCLPTLLLAACAHTSPPVPTGRHPGCEPYWDRSATPPPGGWAKNCPPAPQALHDEPAPPGWHYGCKPYWDDNATPPPGGWAQDCPRERPVALPTAPNIRRGASVFDR